MNYKIREMTIEDYDKVYAFWKTINGLRMDESDTRKNIAFYLVRNPRLNYVVIEKDEIIGTIKCGQDGRRGYIYHLAVKEELRKLGIAKKLYTMCIDELKRQGIWRCNLYVLNSNENALSFWQYNEWEILDNNFKMLQKDL